MALDHVRDVIHRGAMSYSPTDLTRTTPLLFLTRWITHFCAPTFMFTAGLGAFLWWHQGRTRRDLSRFLVTRGLWLVVLELTVMRLAYDFNLFQPDPILLLVLWVLGVCMIGLAALVWLPMRWLTVFSVSVIVLHNGLDFVQASRFGAAAWLWNLLHQTGVFRVSGITVVVGYPLIPWIAVMALGFCFGPLFLTPPSHRQRFCRIAGAAALAGFFVLRAIDGYGDPSPWMARQSAAYTAMSFLNTTKYPPSLAFLLMTLGPALLLLAWFDEATWTRSNALIVFGQVPLFYFVLHFFAAHAIAVALALIRYGGAALAFIFRPVPSMGSPPDLFPPQFGYDLWVAYAVWILIVVALYPICRWFAGVKAARRTWWLSYL